MSFYPKLLLLFATTLFSSFAHAESSFRVAHESDTVEWRKWSTETLDEAKASGKPLFFFVGHYGNSLARSMLSETFQNKTIASTLNDTAVPILVDINEEPELSALLGLMASQHFSANELPTCLWTDTNLAPLNGGGYFPPTDDWGGQGFLSVARNVSEQWTTNQDSFLAPAMERLQESLAKSSLDLNQSAGLSAAFTADTFSAVEAPSLSALDLYTTTLYAKSLPEAASQELLDEIHAFLARVSGGAGFDSIEGGFFIGSNDANWKLPLFQKSTSDQAYMLLALSQLFERDPKSEYKFLIDLTVDFIEKSLLKENGLARQYLDSFAAGETPDMAEGSYYLIEGKQVAKFDSAVIEAWGLSTDGNLDEATDILGIYQGFNVPFSHNPRVLSHELDAERQALRKMRSQKAKPLSDNTGYTATNALVVRALVDVARSTQNESYTQKASQLLQNILKSNTQLAELVLYNSDAKDKKANSNDYVQLAAAALALHEATGDPKDLDTARSIYQSMRNNSPFAPGTLAFPIGVSDITVSIYRDTHLESPLALHFENLRSLGEDPAEIVKSVLGSMPQAVVDLPSAARTLSLLALQAQGPN